MTKSSIEGKMDVKCSDKVIDAIDEKLSFDVLCDVSMVNRTTASGPGDINGELLSVCRFVSTALYVDLE